jgi:hypothetical protein
MRIQAMKQIFALLTATLLLGAAAGTARAAQPRIEATKRVIDLGVQEPGPRLTIDFPIRNAGTAPLEITRVAPMCGCMVARYDRRLLPGAKGSVRVFFDSAGRHGEVRKNITVESTDPKTPRLVLTVRALLRRAIEVSPGETITLPMKEGQPTQGELILRSHEKAAFQITRVTCSLPGARTRLLSSAEIAERVPENPDACRGVQFEIPEEASRTTFETTVVLETTSPRRPRIAVQVTGVPRAAVSVNPPHLYFGNVARKKSEPVLRVITLFRPQGGVRVTGLEASDPHLKLSVEADPSGALCDVLAVYEGGWPLGLKRGTITIRTSDPQRPQVRVPYSAEVSDETEPGSFRSQLPAPGSQFGTWSVERRGGPGREIARERIAHASPRRLAPPVGPSPCARVEQEEIDLGTVETGAVAPAVFTLRNQGDAPLRIEGVQTHCGCLVASYDAEIAPGEAGTIRAELNTRAHQGPMRKTIHVTTNDPGARQLALTVTATVRRAVAVEPGEQILLPLVPGRSAEQTVSLRPLDGQSFRIVAIASSEPRLAAESVAEGYRSGAAGGPAVHLRVPPAAGSHPFTAVVTVTLDHPKLPAVTLEVRGYPRPALRCFPEALRFGEIDAQGEGSREILLTGDPKLHLLGVDLPDARVRAEPTALPDGEGWRIRVTLRGEGRPGPVRGSLTLRTDDPVTPRVQVPYTAAIRPSSIRSNVIKESP